MKCPKCGHEWPAENQRAGGKARWHGTTKKQRSEAARKAVKARWAKRPNAGDERLPANNPKI